ncbi:unnamed protein product [Brassica oleracea var. botrytis]|uniref:Knottin scorpion toxin-like domain-containing protein n=2 Tax=Brassica TaxID=3705 RepID=A0A0D2ZWK9_BRAOL|nr:putative defensin-like protein 38 [Brassica napus]CAF1859475.1 unnamed protein product [Brassica napus]CDY46390.1 BnaC04g33090D [Brassica napus]
MASSVNSVVFVVFLMILLISTEIQNGHAQRQHIYCEKVRSKTAPPDTCNKKDADALCKNTCWTRETYIEGKCLLLPKTTKKACYCWQFNC